MQLHSAVSVVWMMLSVTGGARAYLIDRDSCNEDQYNFVKRMVEQAFVMANLIPALVNENPMDPNAEFLLEQLFNIAPGMTNGHANSDIAKGWVENYFTPNGPHHGVLGGILSYQNELTIDDVPNHDLSAWKNPNEVVIFCDTSRLQWRAKDPLHFYDSKAGQAVRASDAAECVNAFMWTKSSDTNYDTIQVCAWFLEYAMEKKYPTGDKLKSIRARLAVKGMDRYISNKFYTPIDLESLWDKTMLHEMMHTKQAVERSDVGGWDGYGWKNCKTLAKKGKPQENADSWALMGSALYSFVNGGPIDEDGNFVTPATSTGMSSRRWIGSGAGRGLGAVKAKAMERVL